MQVGLSGDGAKESAVRAVGVWGRFGSAVVCVC